jgi:hypothetical protein
MHKLPPRVLAEPSPSTPRASPKPRRALPEYSPSLAEPAPSPPNPPRALAEHSRALAEHSPSLAKPSPSPRRTLPSTPRAAPEPRQTLPEPSPNTPEPSPSTPRALAKSSLGFAGSSPTLCRLLAGSSSNPRRVFAQPLPSSRRVLAEFSASLARPMPSSPQAIADLLCHISPSLCRQGVFVELLPSLCRALTEHLPNLSPRSPRRALHELFVNPFSTFLCWTFKIQLAAAAGGKGSTIMHYCTYTVSRHDGVQICFWHNPVNAGCLHSFIWVGWEGGQTHLRWGQRAGIRLHAQLLLVCSPHVMKARDNLFVMCGCA